MAKKKNNQKNKMPDDKKLHTESMQKKESPEQPNGTDGAMQQDKSDPDDSRTDSAVQRDKSDSDNSGTDADSKEKKAPRHEDALDMHFMSRKERIAYKRAQHKEKTSGMTTAQRFRFFFDYYKWQTVLTVSLIAFVVLLGRSIYLGTRPMALGLIVLNNIQSQETELSEVIEADYRKCNTFGKHDRFMVITGLSIDPINYKSETIAAGSNGLSDYETLYYLTSAGTIDVLLSDYDGLSYCVEQDLVYPIDMLFTEDALAPYQQRLKVMTSYTGEERSYAIDVSDSPYLKEQNLGYTSAYIMFPTNDPENNERALNFLEFLLQP